MTGRWAAISTVAKRELAAYFESPVAYVFLVIFLLLRCRIGTGRPAR